MSSKKSGGLNFDEVDPCVVYIDSVVQRNQPEFGLIGILPKSTLSPHRIGPARKQDWIASIFYAIGLETEAFFDHLIETPICVASGYSVSSNGDPTACTSEIEIYKRKLAALDCDNIVCIEEGYDTISQLRALNDYCLEMDEEMIVVCTWVHAIRAKMLCSMYGFDRLVIKACMRGRPSPPDIAIELFCTPVQFLARLLHLDGFLNRYIKRRRCRPGKDD